MSTIPEHLVAVRFRSLQSPHCKHKIQPSKPEGYSTDGIHWTNERPAWLTNFTTSGTGATLQEQFTATVQAQTLIVTNDPHNQKLRATSAVSNYNLSNSTGADAIENTANCYLVNAPGTYSLPLVYGNAIRNGVDNPDSYQKNGSTASGFLAPFVDHANQPITQPYIYNVYTPTNACLVWQDEQDLVSNVALSPDKHSLTFTVSQNNIRQGNAIVAVRDASNTILWSWHIWVTDYELGSDLQTITNYQNVQYTFLPINIGYCYVGNHYEYAARNIQVRITQDETGAQQEFTITQTAFNYDDLGNNPFFQWGRKDPMLGASLNGSQSEKNCYTDSDKTSYKFSINGLNSSNIGLWIQKPHCFNRAATMDDRYLNLWNANNTVGTLNDNPITKTVYDPSPVGF